MNTRAEELKKQIDKLTEELASLTKNTKGATEPLAEGDFVRYGDRIGEIQGITPDGTIIVLFGPGGTGKDEYMTPWSLKRWEAEKGDLCIFWDNEEKDDAKISIYISSDEDSDCYPILSITEEHWENCIPFISKSQYLNLVGPHKLEDDDE